MYMVHVKMRVHAGYFYEESYDVLYSGVEHEDKLGAEAELQEAKHKGYDAIIVKED